MPLGLFFVRRYRLVPLCRIPKQLSLDPGITICKIFLNFINIFNVLLGNDGGMEPSISASKHYQ